MWHKLVPQLNKPSYMCSIAVDEWIDMRGWAEQQTQCWDVSAAVAKAQTRCAVCVGGYATW